MMRFSRDWVIIYLITVLTESENSLGADISKRCKRNDEKDEFQSSESRYNLKPSYPEYTKREYGSKEKQLAVTFRAPHYEAPDYWSYKHEDPDYTNRRTFFEDIRYLPHDRKTTFPDLYQFMTSLFGGRGEATLTTPMPEGFHYSRLTPPYPDESYGFRPTQATYIPPPKPIRASVIKLETITRSPNIYPTFDYDSTTNSHLGSILNHVLIENAKSQYGFGLHHGRYPTAKAKPTPGLPNPVYDPPPTLQPSFEYSEFLGNQTRGFIPFKPTFNYPEKRNETDYKYPTSVQDQLPPVNLENIKIPYVSATPIAYSVTTYSPEIASIRYDHKGNFYFTPSGPNTQQNLEDIIELRNLNQGGASTPKKGRKRPHPKPITFIKTPSVEKITNLTVEGLSSRKSENANIHKYVNYFNMRNLITYEINKLENVPRAQLDKIFEKVWEKNGSASSHFVNLNDELSLDAKILKDTNWDGLSTTDAIQTTNITKEAKVTTKKEEVVQRIRSKPKIKKTDFWAIDEEKEPNSPVPTTEALEEKTTETPTSTTVVVGDEPTTIDSTPFPVTSEATETTPIDITTEETTTLGKSGQRRSETIITESSSKVTTEEPSMIDIFDKTTTVKPSYTRRKYIRRPKTMNFTPYPTAGEVQKKAIIRNNFPKRQKPNITLAFGNKNIIKNREGYTRDEVMQFSDEDIRKRKRKTGKRRHLYVRTRITTSERPDQEKE